MQSAATGRWTDELVQDQLPHGQMDQTSDDHIFWLNEAAAPAGAPPVSSEALAATFTWDGKQSEPFYFVPQRDGAFFIWSPGERHIAYFGQRGDAMLVGVDGEQREYVGFSRSVAPTFSPDDQHLAYGATTAGDFRLIVDGQPFGSWNAAPLRPVYSPDSARLAFVAENRKLEHGDSLRDYSQWLVLAGVDQPRLGMISAAPGITQFSPDSRRFIYGVTDGTDSRLVVDGVPSAGYEYLAFPTFSPDGRRVAFVAGRKKALALVLDGAVASPTYQLMGPPMFSPDSSRLAHVGLHSKGRLSVVVDRVTGPEYAEIWGDVVFSPDSRRVAYLAQLRKKGFFGPEGKWVPVIDGIVGAEWDEVASPPHFSPDGRHVAFSGRRGKDWLMVVDGAPGPAFARVGPPRFSSGGRLGYVVEHTATDEASGSGILVDGSEVVRFDETTEVVPGEAFLWSPDGLHLATVGRFGATWHPIVDQEVGPGFASVGAIRFGSGGISFSAIGDDGVHRLTLPVG